MNASEIAKHVHELKEITDGKITTPRNWIAVRDAMGRKRVYVCRTDMAKPVNYCDSTGLYGWFNEGDAELICAAVNALPALLAAAEENSALRAENEDLRQVLHDKNLSL